MNAPQTRAIGPARWVALLALLTLFLQGGRDLTRAQAQEKPTLVISTNPKEPTRDDTLTRLILRPNVEQALYLYVRNPGEEARKLTVVVETGDKKELARAAVNAAPGKTTRVQLPKMAADKNKPKDKDPVKPADPKAPPAPEAPKVAWENLQGPPFDVRLLLLDEKNQPVETRTEPIVLMVPAQYLTAAATFDAGKLVVAVTAANTFAEPGCPLELSVQPDVFRPLREGELRAGNFKEVVGKAGQTKKLVAEVPPESAGRDGLVYVAADGYQRAFAFPAEFVRRATATAFEARKDPAIRVGGEVKTDAPFKLYSPPVKVYQLQLETDNIPLDTPIGVGIDRTTDGSFDETKLPGSRKQRIAVSPEMPDGGLLFKTEVADWGAEIDAAGLLGKHDMRISAGGVVREGSIMFDSTPPERLEFRNFPKKVVKGKPLTVQAAATDVESGIVRAAFFLAVPGKDGKLPADAAPIAAVTTDGGATWAAPLALPPDKKQHDVTVLFTNGAGLTETAQIKVDLVEPVPVGHVKGKVTEGDRPQPMLKVALADDKGNAVDTKTTNAKGEFLFENIKPGPYKVSCSKPESKTEGSEAVTVEVDKTATVNLSLKRNPTK